MNRHYPSRHTSVRRSISGLTLTDPRIEIEALANQLRHSKTWKVERSPKFQEANKISLRQTTDDTMLSVKSCQKRYFVLKKFNKLKSILHPFRSSKQVKAADTGCFILLQVCLLCKLNTIYFVCELESKLNSVCPQSANIYQKSIFILFDILGSMINEELLSPYLSINSSSDK